MIPKFLLIHRNEAVYDRDLRAPDTLVPIRRIRELEPICESGEHRYLVHVDDADLLGGWCHEEDLYEASLITKAQHDKAQVLDLDAKEAALDGTRHARG